MGKRNNRRSGRNRRNDKKRQPRQNEYAEPTKPSKPKVYHTCELCEKVIDQVNIAISHKDSGKPTHFDCVVNEIKESNDMKPEWEVLYIGAGVFAIVEQLKGKQPKGQPGFTVIKKIYYEEEARKQNPEWRSDLTAVRENTYTGSAKEIQQKM